MVERHDKSADSDSSEGMTYGEYLILSARQGDLDTVIECIEEAEVPVSHSDASGNCALHMACANNHPEIVKYLLKANADIN